MGMSQKFENQHCSLNKALLKKPPINHQAAFMMLKCYIDYG
jgi:hypothetical protein